MGASRRSTSVKEGDALPELAYDVTATTVVLGALASRDWRPMHHDKDFAQQRNGVRDIFLNTPNQAAWFERYLTDWSGPARPPRPHALPHEATRCSRATAWCSAAGRAVADDAGCGLADVAVTLSVGDRVCTECSARIALPDARGRQPLDAQGDRLEAVRARGAAMDLDFTRRAGALRDTVRRRVRGVRADSRSCAQMEDDPTGYPAELWKQLGELGRHRAADSRRVRRLGRSRTLEAAIVYEELGRSLAPSPHFPSAVVAAGAAARGGQRRAEDGVAAAHRVGRRDPRRPPGSSPTTASVPRACSSAPQADGDGFVLSGMKRHVLFARAATRLVVLARTGDAPSRRRPLPASTRARRASRSPSSAASPPTRSTRSTSRTCASPQRTASAASAAAGRPATP